MDVRYYASKVRGSKIVAFADVVVGEGIIVRGFKIIEGEKGLFAAVPSRSFTVEGSPRFMNQVMFTAPELRERFLGELLAGYRRWRAEGHAEPEATDAEVPF